MNKHAVIIYLIAALWGIVGAMTFMAAPFTFMAFDTEEAMTHLPTVMFVLSFVAIPITSLGSVSEAIKRARSQQTRAAYLVLLLPLVPIAACALSLLCIEVFQGGRL